MAKAELGTKRLCASCGAKFYDLSKDPITCPKCSTVFQVVAPTSRGRPDAASLARLRKGVRVRAQTLRVDRQPRDRRQHRPRAARPGAARPGARHRAQGVRDATTARRIVVGKPSALSTRAEP